MRRLARRLFALTATLSLVLCVAVCLLWVRSYWVTDFLSFKTAKLNRAGDHIRDHKVSVARGRLYVYALRATFAPLASGREAVAQLRWDTSDNPDMARWWRHASCRPPAGHDWHGFHFGASAYRNPAEGIDNSSRSAVIPAWCLVLLSAILPGRWLVARARQQRAAAAGLCVICGYDLRASPERCPECGVAGLRVERAVPLR